jgi:hypothetical protein
MSAFASFPTTLKTPKQVRAVLSFRDKLAKVWGEQLLSGDLGLGHHSRDSVTSGPASLCADAAESAKLASAYVNRFTCGTRVEARIRVSSVVAECFPLSDDMLALVRVLHIPGTANNADLEQSAFQRELLDPCFDKPGPAASGPLAGHAEGADFDGCDGVGGCDVDDASVRKWQVAPALRFSAKSVSVHAVVSQISGIAALLARQLDGRGSCASLRPNEHLGAVLLTLACGYTSHGVLARARRLLTDLPDDAREYAAAAGVVYSPDTVPMLDGAVGSDIDCSSFQLRRHLSEHRHRGCASDHRDRVEFVEVSDLCMLPDAVAEAMNRIVSWGVAAPGSKKFGLTSGPLCTTAKSVHISGQRLMLWVLRTAKGGVATSSCLSRAEAIVRVWQHFDVETRLQLAGHAAAGCRLVVAPGGKTVRCICEVAVAAAAAASITFSLDVPLCQLPAVSVESVSGEAVSILPHGGAAPAIRSSLPLHRTLSAPRVAKRARSVSALPRRSGRRGDRDDNAATVIDAGGGSGPEEVAAAASAVTVPQRRSHGSKAPASPGTSDNPHAAPADPAACLQRTVGLSVLLRSASLDSEVPISAGFHYNSASEFSAAVKDICRRAYMVASIVHHGFLDSNDEEPVAGSTGIARAGAGTNRAGRTAIDSTTVVVQRRVLIPRQVVRWQMVRRSSGEYFPSTPKDGSALRSELAIRVALDVGAAMWPRGWSDIYVTHDESVSTTPGASARSRSLFFASSSAAELQFFIFEDLLSLVLKRQSRCRAAALAASMKRVSARERTIAQAGAGDPFAWLTRCRTGGPTALETALPSVVRSALLRARFAAQYLASERLRQGRSAAYASTDVAYQDVHASVLSFFDPASSRLSVPDHVMRVVCQDWWACDSVPHAWAVGNAPRWLGGTRQTSGARLLWGFPLSPADFDLPVSAASRLDDDVLFGTSGISRQDPDTLLVDPLPFPYLSMFLAVAVSDCNRVLRSVAATQRDHDTSQLQPASATPPVHGVVLRGNLQCHPALTVESDRVFGRPVPFLPAAEVDALRRLHSSIVCARITLLAFFQQHEDYKRDRDGATPGRGGLSSTLEMSPSCERTNTRGKRALSWSAAWCIESDSSAAAASRFHSFGTVPRMELPPRSASGVHGGAGTAAAGQLLGNQPRAHHIQLLRRAAVTAPATDHRAVDCTGDGHEPSGPPGTQCDAFSLLNHRLSACLCAQRDQPFSLPSVSLGACAAAACCTQCVVAVSRADTASGDPAWTRGSPDDADISALLVAAVSDVSSTVTPRQACGFGCGGVGFPLRGDSRTVSSVSCSGERLLLAVLRDLFATVLATQPFGVTSDAEVADRLLREWSLSDCQSVRWWIVQTCLLGTLFPGPESPD